MTCAAQAAEILKETVDEGDTVLDVGCGSGYFFRSLQERSVPVEYWGVDSSPSLIEIGRRHLPAIGLDPSRLQVVRIEDLDGRFDHVVCMNVISNLDNFHRPLERMLQMAKKTVVLRESIAEKSEYRYVKDEYLDPGVELYVHVNTYARSEITAFMEARGFRVNHLIDERTRGKPEMVIGYPHHWAFVVATRSPESK